MKVDTFTWGFDAQLHLGLDAYIRHNVEFNLENLKSVNVWN